MNDFNKEFHTLARNVRLTDAERRRILSALPAPSPRAVPSPFFFVPSAARFAFAFAVLFIIIGAGGAAYASGSALPGDALYPLKVAVAEPIEGALASTPEAKLAWNAKVAETRLDEAIALAAKGELTATTSAELAANFNSHAAALPNADVHFASLVAAKAGNVLAAGKGSGNASSTIESGRLVLAIAIPRASADTDAAEAAPMMKAMSAPADEGFAPAQSEPVPEAAPATLMAPMMMKATLAPAAPPDDAALAETLSVEAHGALDDATTTAASLAAPLTDDAEARLSDLSSLVVKAEAERIVGSTTEAIGDFEESLRLAAELMLILNGDASSDAAPADASSSQSSMPIPYPI